MTHKITNGHKKLRDNDLISFSYNVTAKMEANPIFPEPPAALADLKKILPEYQEVNYKSRGGDEELRFLRKGLRAQVLNLLAKLADYVTVTCNGDPAKLVTSGFELARTRGPKLLSVIQELKVAIDHNGEAVTEVKRVAGAKAYIHQYTTDPLVGDNVWVNKCTTKTVHTFTGLKSKERYWFQVIAVGLNGTEVASPLVSRVIQ